MYPLANVLGPLGHRPYSLPWSSGSTLNTGLVSWWDLDETSGTRVDSVGSNDLTDQNTVGFISGKIGNAAAFVAANNEVLHVSADFFTGDYTISLWTDMSLAGTKYVLAGYDPVANLNGPKLYWTNATNRYSFLHDGSVGAIVDVATTSQWRHLVLWAEDDTLYFTSSTSNTPGEIGSVTRGHTGISGPFVLGGTVNGGTFTGSLTDAIDLCGVWSRVLTADERTELYNLGAGIKNTFTDNGEGFRQGLVSYWNLDEESGTRADSVGSNDLTDNNTVGYAAGKIGNAASFVVANTEYLSKTTPSLPTGTMYSCGWIKTVGTQNNDGCWSQNTATSNSCWGLMFVGNVPYWRTQAGANTVDLIWAGGAVSSGAWHFIEGYFDPANDKVGLAVDGSAWQTSAQAGADTLDNTGNAFWIGGYYGTAYTIDADIDEVEVYFRLPSDDERTAKYAAGAGRFYDFQV